MVQRNRLRPVLFALAFALCAGLARPANASVRDAELSGLWCSACHTSGAGLNGIGRAWAARSNRLEPIGDIPLISVKSTVAYVSDGNGPGLSKTIVDYLVLYLNGKIAPNVAYVVQQHIVDGGAPGFTREAFLQWRRPKQRYAAGAMALPLLIDPERFRLLHEDYLMFAQTVGNNPFDLKSSHPMAGGFTGDALRGTEVGAFAVAGHEAGSGVAQTGTDGFFAVTQRMPGLTLSAISYAGTRVLGSVPDHFTRLTYAAVADRGPWRLDLAFAHGQDGNPGTGMPVTSSGGLVQVHGDLTSALFAEARYEGIADSSGVFVRQAVIGAGRRFSPNFRLTVEDGITRDTRTHNMLHAVAAFGVSNARVGSGSY